MKRQSGTTLIITLIALGLTMVMAVSLLNSTYTASDIVGNTASKQAAAEAADIAVNAAAVWMTARTDMDTAATGIYYATQQAVDAAGLPAVDWSAVASTQVGNFQVQYLIERLCDGPLPVLDTNAARQCAGAPTGGASASQRAGAPAYARKSPAYYRVTVRIAGPKSSESYVQAVLSK
jgi:type IV pilus assembly protein PilX